MKIFGFYSKKDSSKEIIGKCKVEDRDSAIIYFSKIKALKISWFTDLYEVVELQS